MKYFYADFYPISESLFNKNNYYDDSDLIRMIKLASKLLENPALYAESYPAIMAVKYSVNFEALACSDYCISVSDPTH